jgi:DUF4097 and DUF4098 domain-containing protein YvlB
MLKRMALFGAAALACVALARGEDWNKVYSVGPGASLRVDAKDGAVTVRAWDEKSISARVTAMGWKIGPGELEIVERQTGDRVEIDLKLPSMRWNTGRRSIQVEVQVPRETRLDIRTGDGAIRVTDVGGELRLTTGDGSITAEGGVLGSLQARTGDGRIAVRGRVNALSLHTGDGSITAEVMPGSKPSTSWRIETGDGSVTLRLPSDFSADLDVHTGDGGVTVDLPMTAERREKQTVKGKLNGGGPVVTVRSGDGSVKVGRI